jgi:hemerythrin superfamily protein
MTEMRNTDATTAGADLSLGTDDVIGFLLSQHRQVESLLEEVSRGAGTARQQAFDELREMLARHETAEEMILRPLTKKVPGGESIADERFAEENESKVQLAELEKLDVDSAEFTSQFETFRTAVLAHAQAEERLEFPALRQNTEEETLRKAKGKLEKAEAMAPTHPHPTAKNNAMNYVAGPFASMLDRAKDAFSRSSD